MPLLFLSHSIITGAGQGLFTKEPINKGELIIEYTGDITSWKEVKNNLTNRYIYFVNENHVINAKNHPRSLARYANDANGYNKVKGPENNSEFINMDGRIFIKATRNIASGSEILVDYGTGYWDSVKKIEERKFRKKNQ